MSTDPQSLPPIPEGGYWDKRLKKAEAGQPAPKKKKDAGKAKS